MTARPRKITSIIAVLSAALFSAFVFTVTALGFSVPALNSPVTDEAGVLSSATESELNNLLSDLWKSGGPQIAVLTVSSLDGLEIEQASIKVVDEWKLGDQKRDDGVLLMIAPHERRIRIEVGYGLEGQLPDALAKRIINEIVKPAFRAREYDAGVINAVNAIISYTDPKFASSHPMRNRYSSPLRLSGTFWFFIILCCFLYIAGRIERSQRSFYSRNGVFRGGFGGGFRGGGGGFGGGGASGGW